MKGKIENKDWTDALKDSLKDFEVTPSDVLFERLEADTVPKVKVAWWWPALACAAVLTAVGIFLFRPQESLLDMKVEGMVAVAEPSEIYLSVQEPKELAASLLRREQAVVEVQDVENDVPEEGFAGLDVEPEEPDVAPEELKEEVEVQSEEIEGLPIDFQESDMDVRVTGFGSGRKKRRVTVGVSFGSGLMASAANMTPGNPGSGIRRSSARYDIGDFLEHGPQNFRSLDLLIPISDRFHIETGFSTTELHASFQRISQDLVFNGLPLRLGYCL